MSKLLRYYSDGNIYFVTIVTNQRDKSLVKYNDLLWESINIYRQNLGFTLIAYVILPDHLHFVIDPKMHDLSSILQKVKLSFSKKVRFHLGLTSGYIWQKRFWDHVIRDQNDINKHIDYIHYNPVKHGYVKNPSDWQQSSFHEYARRGVYGRDWGVVESLKFEGDFGE